MPRILLLSLENEIWTEGVCRILERSGHHAILVESAEDLRFEAGSTPDLLLLNGQLAPDFWLTISALWPDRKERPAMILLSSDEERAGAGQLPFAIDAKLNLKAPQDLLACVDQVFETKREPANGNGQANGHSDLHLLLSPREMDVVSLARLGLRNKEIARQLRVSEGTVKMHLHHVFTKTGLRGRAELILRLAGPARGRDDTDVLAKPKDMN